jgi:hypothetical protein
MLSLDQDRRAHARVSLERPCKLYDGRTGRYVAGLTLDVSGGGVQVRTAQAVNLSRGDEVFIGIAQTRRQAILQTNEMMRGRVARCILGPDGGAALGIELQAKQDGLSQGWGFPGFGLAA